MLLLNEKKTLDVRQLSVSYRIKNQRINAVNNVNFKVSPGECLAIVGESGSGKSTIAATILGVLDRRQSDSRGVVNWGNDDLLKINSRKFNLIRCSEISMIFQNPSQALHPMFTIQDQMKRVFLKAKKNNPAKDTLTIFEALEFARLNHVSRILNQYPHELSGGMKQRVMIAMSLLGRPELIIADEPTSSLDATVQLEIIELLRQIIYSFGTSLLLISHHLGVVAGLADSVLVLKEGIVMEKGQVLDVLMSPKNDYTKELMNSNVQC